MRVFQDLAYAVFLGPFPLVAVMGFATYTVIVAAAVMASGKKWSKLLRRVPVKVHRGMGILAVLLGTLHLLMGVSLYV